MTRAAILALTGPALDEAITEHVSKMELDPTCRYWFDKSTSTFVYRGDWHPSADLNQVRTLELALTAEQQRAYAATVWRMVWGDDDQNMYMLLTADATTRCRALLLVVGAPEE